MVYLSVCFSSFAYFFNIFQGAYTAFFLICGHMHLDLMSSHTPVLPPVHIAAILHILCSELSISCGFIKDGVCLLFFFLLLLCDWFMRE